MTNWIIQEENHDYSTMDEMAFQDMLQDCAIYGNKHLGEYVPEWFKTLIDTTQLEYMIDDIDHGVTDLGLSIVQTVKQVRDNYLGDLPIKFRPDVITPDMAKAVYDALKEQYYYDNPTTLCTLLSAITGQEWVVTDIHGYCQSDWNRLYHPDDDTIDIQWIEAEYFGLYTDYSIYSDDDGIKDFVDSCRVYGFENEMQTFKNALGDLLQDGDTVELRTISGYVTVPKYASNMIEL